MPHVLLYFTSDLWPARERVVTALDAEFSTSGDFDTFLCKYRLIEIEEYVVVGHQANERSLAERNLQSAQPIRALLASSTVRCEIITFGDRPPAACSRITDACRKGLFDALSTEQGLTGGIEISVAILQTGRASYRRTHLEGPP